MDANPPVDTMQALGEMCVSAGVPLWYEPTSIPKSSRLLQAPAALRATKWLSPNLHELSAMAEAAAQGATGAGVGFEELSREVAVAVQDVLLSDTGEQGSNKTMASNLATLLQAMVGIGDKGARVLGNPSSCFICLHFMHKMTAADSGMYVRRPDGSRQAPRLCVSWAVWFAVGGCCLVADRSSSTYHRYGALITSICCAQRQKNTTRMQCLCSALCITW